MIKGEATTCIKLSKREVVGYWVSNEWIRFLLNLWAAEMFVFGRFVVTSLIRIFAAALCSQCILQDVLD